MFGGRVGGVVLVFTMKSGDSWAGRSRSAMEMVVSLEDGGGMYAVTGYSRIWTIY